MLLAMIRKAYAENRNVPTKPETNYKGVIIWHPKNSRRQRDFRSLICDCGSSGCCSY